MSVGMYYVCIIPSHGLLSHLGCILTKCIDYSKLTLGVNETQRSCKKPFFGPHCFSTFSLPIGRPSPANTVRWSLWQRGWFSRSSFKNSSRILFPPGTLIEKENALPTKQQQASVSLPVHLKKKYWNIEDSLIVAVVQALVNWVSYHSLAAF